MYTKQPYIPRKRILTPYSSLDQDVHVTHKELLKLLPHRKHAYVLIGNHRNPNRMRTKFICSYTDQKQ